MQHICTNIQNICTNIQNICTNIQNICTNIQNLRTNIQNTCTNIQNICTHIQHICNVCLTYASLVAHMGWLRLVGSLKLPVSFAKEPHKRDDILQKRPIKEMTFNTYATYAWHMQALLHITHMSGRNIYRTCVPICKDIYQYTKHMY